MRTHFLYFVQKVARQNDRLAPGCDLLNQPAYLSDTHRVESIGWLIQYEYRWLIQQCRRNGQSLLHAQRVGFIGIVLPRRKFYEIEYAWNIARGAFLDCCIKL